MSESMTGFSQAASHFNGIQINLEMRSLNHRYLECLFHSPDGLGGVEEVVKEQVRAKISRGRITVVLSVVKQHPRVLVDYDLAQNYVKTLKDLGRRLKLETPLNLSQIIGLEGILKVEKTALTPEFIQAIKALAQKTLEKLVRARQKEGRAITADILRRIALIKKESEKITACSKHLCKEKKNILSEDEYGVFLKNTDIAEELTRITYHLKNFLNTIKKSAACGKELDFIAQELQREANTISAKAQSAPISSSVVKIKSAVDRIREQVQNVE